MRELLKKIPGAVPLVRSTFTYPFDRPNDASTPPTWKNSPGAKTIGSRTLEAAVLPSKTVALKVMLPSPAVPTFWKATLDRSSAFWRNPQM